MQAIHLESDKICCVLVAAGVTAAGSILPRGASALALSGQQLFCALTCSTATPGSSVAQ